MILCCCDPTHDVTVLRHHGLLQAISVIVTHRTDDMTKLPPRLPVNAPKPPKAPAPTRPKLRLGQVAMAPGAASEGPGPGPSGHVEGASLGEGSQGFDEGVGEAKTNGGPAAFASPAKVHPSKAAQKHWLTAVLM